MTNWRTPAEIPGYEKLLDRAGYKLAAAAALRTIGPDPLFWALVRRYGPRFDRKAWDRGQELLKA